MIVGIAIMDEGNLDKKIREKYEANQKHNKCESPEGNPSFLKRSRYF
jgi:hypothetical protein